MYGEPKPVSDFNCAASYKGREGMDVWLHAFLIWAIDTRQLYLSPDCFFCWEIFLVPTKLRGFGAP